MHKKNAEKNGQKSWFHAEEFHKQRALIEKNLKTEIFEALKSRPELDVSHLRVHVRGERRNFRGNGAKSPRGTRHEENCRKYSGGLRSGQPPRWNEGN